MTDVLLTDTFDLAISGGDLLSGESTQQHQQLLLLVAPGELRQYPAVGVGLREYQLDDVGIGAINGDIKRQFEADGMTVKQISSSGDALQIDAYYE